MLTKIRRFGALLALALPLALTACAGKSGDGAGAAVPGSAASQPAVHPVSGLAIIPLTITHAGRQHGFRVEVARTSAQQEQGLMFRTTMGADEGMIFPMNPPRGAAFWMKNTVIPLDIIFIAPGGKIINIAANATPYSLDPLESGGVVKGVLELNGGRAAELGIGPGDVVQW